MLLPFLLMLLNIHSGTRAHPWIVPPGIPSLPNTKRFSFHIPCVVTSSWEVQRNIIYNAIVLNGHIRQFSSLHSAVSFITMPVAVVEIILPVATIAYRVKTMVLCPSSTYGIAHWDPNAGRSVDRSKGVPQSDNHRTKNYTCQACWRSGQDS